MIEYQSRGERTWYKLNDWQLISLSDINRFTFKFHGKLVDERKYLNAYIEKEIIHAKLSGMKISKRISSGRYRQ